MRSACRNISVCCLTVHLYGAYVNCSYEIRRCVLFEQFDIDLFPAGGNLTEHDSFRFLAR